MKYLILKVTKNCNLRCKYCYANLSNEDSESFEIDNLDNTDNMNFETAKKAIDYLLTIDKDLKIQFTGGEPLLNFELLKKVVNYCNSEYNSTNKNCKYNINFAIQTNGTIINSEIIKFIKTNKIGLGISLDDLNNEFRIYANNKPCKIDILKNMAIFKANNVHFGVTSVITSNNLDEAIIEELIIYLISMGVHSISFDFLKLKNKDKFKDNDVFEPDYNDFIKLIDKLGSKNYPISIKNLNRKKKAKLNNSANSFENYCYLNSGDLLYINECGDIYSCPTLEGIKNMYIGNINNIKDLNSKNFKLPKFKSKGCFARNYLKNND
ncbi:uncharacterized protein M2325_001450 [Methanococcus voltae PS]|uniref:Radical SAM core domain-containing protein n=1 Tax=Methanococcus voltae PS TaxID=523842 RepID=A0ABT2EY05_METVO|nr:radical SAM protein [Methanococcus voltae]MCS3922740.1 uncharacterized protein [Methanococcus voltae PS]